MAAAAAPAAAAAAAVAAARRRSRRRSAAPLLAAAATAAVAAILLSVAAPPRPAVAAAVATPTSRPLVDAAKARSQLLDVVSSWTRAASPPAGAPRGSTPFHVALQRDWSRVSPPGTTVIAQARGVYINAEAARAAAAAADDRAPTYVDAVRGGVATLLGRYRDATDGGYVWAVTDAPGGGVVDGTKDGYGNAHVLFALATAVGVLPPGGDRDAAVDAARGCLSYIRSSLADEDGGIKRRAVDGWGARYTRSIDPLTHYFEALLGWYDVLPDGAERTAVAAEATRTGTFIVNRTVVGEAGDAAASAYVAYNYNTDWTPSTGAYSRGTQWTTAATATPPHGMELAFLLSRAEQRGLAPPGGGGWVATAYRLMRYAEKHAFDARGWLRYEVTTYAGAPLAGNPDNDVYVWWAESEAARAYLHFAVDRGAAAVYGARAATSAAALDGPFTDSTYGGWYRQLRVDGLGPDGTPKWDRWKVAYHFSMLHAETLRLAGEL